MLSCLSRALGRRIERRGRTHASRRKRIPVDRGRRQGRKEDGVKAPRKGMRIAASLMAAALGRLPAGEPVDLTRPFEGDRDTICLFHLDDVAGEAVKDSVPGGKPGRVKEPATAEGMFGRALSCDGEKGWADVDGLAKVEGLRALTVECWVKLRDRAAGDVICRGGQYMIRLSTSVTASFWIDGAWRYVSGTASVPVGRWTHVAITWDQGKKEVAIYLDGRLDTAGTPEGIADGVLGGGLALLRVGGHTGQSPAP